MLPFLQQNAPVLVLSAIYGGLTVIMAVMIVRHRKYGVVFPPLDSRRVLYRERWASARSHRSGWTRLASANNCVSVAVIDDEVRVWLPFPFSMLGYELDLEHRIPRKAIRGLEERPYFFNRMKFFDWLIGRAYLLDYTDKAGQMRRIELVLHRPLDFLKALNSKAESTS